MPATKKLLEDMAKEGKTDITPEGLEREIKRADALNKLMREEGHLLTEGDAAQRAEYLRKVREITVYEEKP